MGYIGGKNMANEIKKNIEGEVMEALQELKENIMEVEVDDNNINESYNKIFEEVRKYEDISCDSLDEFFEDYVSIEEIERETLEYARCNDLMSIQYLLKNLDLICATFKKYKYIGFVGGIRNINGEDIKELKENIINYANKELGE